MSSRVIQCFLGADLRNGHDGLAKLATKDKINVGALKDGEYVLFINNKHDKLKLYASSNVVAYLRLLRGQKLDLRTVALIPRAFQGTGRIDYDNILRETITAGLARKGRQSALAAPLAVMKRRVKQPSVETPRG